MPKIIIPLLVLLFSACKQMPDVTTAVTPYRPDIQQGNVVTQDMVEKLKPGMTRAQVRFALGSPLIVDPFRTDRWDYIYMLQRQGKETERRSITVIFEDDKLLRIDGDIAALPPAIKPAPAEKPLASAPAEKPAAVAAPAASTPAPVARTPASPAPVAKPPVAPAPKTPATTAVKPATVKPVASAPDEAVKPVPAKGDNAPPAATAAPVEASKPDTAKAATAATKSEAAKDKPKQEKGFFGRLRDKLGL
jgi:outer membrane protein assembly factor BamE